jgi:hypothetical protein
VLCIRWSALHISRFSLFTIFHESWIQKIWRKRLRKQKIPRVITTYAREKMTYTTSSFVLDSRWKAIPNDIYFFTNALVGEELISILPFKQVKPALANKNKITETLLLGYWDPYLRKKIQDLNYYLLIYSKNKWKNDITETRTDPIPRPVPIPRPYWSRPILIWNILTIKLKDARIYSKIY